MREAAVDWANWLTAHAYSAIEATCHAPSWEGVYGEIFKVLKPGGTVGRIRCQSERGDGADARLSDRIQFGVYEWCMTDDFDQSNPRHKEIQHGIELGNGIPEMRPIAKARDALKAVGFQIEHEEDLAQRPDRISWWYSISGDMSKVQSLWDYPLIWRMTKFGRNLTGYGVWALEKARLVPKGTYDVQEALKVAGAFNSKALVRSSLLVVYLTLSLSPFVQPTPSLPAPRRTSLRR